MPITSNFYGKIGQTCISALLEEVATTPKPGLVDSISSGAHNDMDYSTFLSSIEAIGPYFSLFAEAGAKLETIGHASIEMLRPIGVQCEKAMYKATNGVNTHKGAIFSLGILASAAGYCKERMGSVSVERVCEVSADIGKTTLKDFEKKNDGNAITNGQRIYNEHGITGVRGEAASGFASARKYALPLMHELFTKKAYQKNDIYVQVLLNLMCNVVDTNVIARKGLDAMQYVQKSAAEVLSLGGVFTREGKKRLLELDTECIRLNISPGGCADLLSVAIFLYNLESLEI